MSEAAAIRIKGLHKQFGRRRSKRVQAVRDLNLTVETGQVYGFLGPNGAGKTTTIRMLLDLIRPNQGDVYLFGKHVRKERAVLGRVGAMVEGAQFYNFLSGRRNLEVFALSSNITLAPTRYDELLDVVGMLDRANRRVRGYSTGMKQRLGIAAALLTDPDLLILDEPANGLDPHGINEIRMLIRRLADDHGKTVFLSSHQLGEVEQVCDRVAIIHRGELLREGNTAELVTEKARIRLRTTPLEKARAVLTERWTCTRTDDDALLVDVPETLTPDVVKTLVEHDVKIFEVSPYRQSLENIFLAITEGENTHVD